MDYAKVTARLSYFAENLSKMFSRPEPNQIASWKHRRMKQRRDRLWLTRKTKEQEKSPGAPGGTPGAARSHRGPGPVRSGPGASGEAGCPARSHLRLAAEYDNFRKRTQKEKEASYANARPTPLAAFLPIYDNLERALNQPAGRDAAIKGRGNDHGEAGRSRDGRQALRPGGRDPSILTCTMP